VFILIAAGAYWSWGFALLDRGSSQKKTVFSLKRGNFFPFFVGNQGRVLAALSATVSHIGFKTPLNPTLVGICSSWHGACFINLHNSELV